MNVEFDRAVELLEIVDIENLTPESLARLAKRARQRWHPDRVSHLNDPEKVDRFTRNFQSIDQAVSLVEAFLRGEVHAGSGVNEEAAQGHSFEEPEDVIRRNAPEIQASLKEWWTMVRSKGFKKTTEEAIVSDGFKLKDALRADLADDIGFLSIYSMYFGLLFWSFVIVVASLVELMLLGSQFLTSILLVLPAAHLISCFLGVAPLSRYWLPPVLSELMRHFIQLGVDYGAAIERRVTGRHSWPTVIVIVIAVRLPYYFSLGVKWIILVPAYEIASALVGDRVVGVVKEQVTYYAGFADWYVEKLIAAKPEALSGEELYHLSRLYAEFSEVR